MNIEFDNGMEHRPELFGNKLYVSHMSNDVVVMLLSEDRKHWRAIVARSECDTLEKLQLFADICAARYGLPVIIEGENT